MYTNYMSKAINLTAPKPQVFDGEYIASLNYYQKEDVRNILSCDWLKANRGLTDQMWIPGTLAEASSRIDLLKAYA
jgi:hypothetical protein